MAEPNKKEISRLKSKLKPLKKLRAKLTREFADIKSSVSSSEDVKARRKEANLTGKVKRAKADVAELEKALKDATVLKSRLRRKKAELAKMVSDQKKAQATIRQGIKEHGAREKSKVKQKLNRVQVEIGQIMRKIKAAGGNPFRA